MDLPDVGGDVWEVGCRVVVAPFGVVGGGLRGRGRGVGGAVDVERDEDDDNEGGAVAEALDAWVLEDLES